MSVALSRQSGGIKIVETVGGRSFETNIINPGQVTIATDSAFNYSLLTVICQGFNRQFQLGDITQVNGATPPQDINLLADLLRDNVFLEPTARLVTAINNISGGGGGGSTYTYIQNSAATVWNINHNLGYYPSVVVIDTSGNTIQTDVTYVDSNNLILSFSVPEAGKAYLNV